MEIKIDLDMNKIDYETINKKLVEKIADMDLYAKYNFKYTIDSKIDEEVKQCVTEFLRTRRWGDFNNSSKEEMRNVLYGKIKELIEPHVNNIIAQIPEEEMNKIIIDLIPKVLVDLLSQSLKDTLIGYWNTSSQTIISEAAHRIKSNIY